MGRRNVNSQIYINKKQTKGIEINYFNPILKP